MERLGFRIKMRLKMVIVYLFYLPGLIMHEGAHAAAALLTMSKIVGFGIVPTIKFFGDGRYEVVYGYVNSIARIKAAYMFIGAAPLFLPIIPYLIAIHSGWIDVQNGTVMLGALLRLENFWFFFLVVQVLWGCIPSRQDVHMFFHGMLSPSGVLLMTAIVTAVYYGL